MPTLDSDVIIVGGGVIGCSIAYHLAREGRRALVLEKNGIGGAASAGAVGVLNIDSVPFRHDALRALAIQSRSLFKSFSEQARASLGIDIDLDPCGTLRVATVDFCLEGLRLEARWHRDHVGAVEELSGPELRRRWPWVEGDCAGGLFYPGDFQVTSARVVEAYRIGAERSGAVFKERCGDILWITRGSSVERVEAAGGVFRAEQFVLAAGSWSGVTVKQIGLNIPVEPARGQLLILEKGDKETLALSPLPAEGRVSVPVYVVGPEGFSYLCPKPDGHYYLGTTVEKVGYDASCTDEALDRIASDVAVALPFIGKLPVKGSWAGFRPDTPDHLPIIGPARGWDNLWVATGHFRKGILLAPITGQIMATLLAGRKPLLDITAFSPERF